MKIPSPKIALVAMAVFGLACSNSKKTSLDAGNDTGGASGSVDGSAAGTGEETGVARDGDDDNRALLDGAGREDDGPAAGSANDASAANADGIDAGADDDSGVADVGTGTTCTGACQIAGVCYQNGSSNPDNPCLLCDVRRSTSGWSANDGATCDDGLFCTVADKCLAGECRGLIRDCSDGVACNGLETCDELSNSCVPGTNACTGNTMCESRTGRCVASCPGCAIGGTCYSDSQVNPANPCQKCSKALKTSGWSNNDGATCDDNLFCTVGDKCSAGDCAGTPRNCSDGIACNGTETCDEATDACAAGTTTCESDQVCNATSGQCVAVSTVTCPGCVIEGTCYGNGQPNPANPCQKCTPASSASVWSDNDGAVCDDGAFCTVGDKCLAGDCAGTERNCSDAIACNGAETCDEDTDACVAGTTTCTESQVCDTKTGGCVAISTCPGCVIDHACFGDGQANPSNPCQKCVPSTSASDWTDNDGVVCDDGLFCTVGDTCADGTCAGTERRCSDGIACNGTETCEESSKSCKPGTPTCTGGEVCNVTTGSCVALTTCPGCLIGGTCYGVGQTRPDHPCEKCASAGATTWGNADGATCDDGLFCNGADTCAGGSCTLHGTSPCGGGLTCIEDKKACYPVDVSFCNSLGNVVQYNSAGEEVLVQTCVSAAKHGTCSGGACGCQSGYVGADCHSTTYVAHVSGSSGRDDATGGSWDAAVATVKKGLELAEAQATLGGGGYVAFEVWVAAGTYKPGSNASDTILLKNHVALYGGFAGTETARSQRDFASHVTVLSGDNINHHVVTGATGATIDGFTISGGHAEGPEGNGGGMLNVNASPTISNCSFSANTAEAGGGGLHNDLSSPVLSNCTFSGNSTPLNGGAILSLNSSSVQILNGTFSGNSAGKLGGGMYSLESSFVVSNSVFWGDAAGESGPEILAFAISSPAPETSVSYSIVQGGYASGTNILTGAPLFVSATDLHLTATSPAIDQGIGCGPVPSTDKDGNPRRDVADITNATTGVDIGAYEYQAGSTVTTLCH